MYLNGGFEGGATAFRESRASLLVTPERGKALVFYHRQLHEGLPVVRGRKYVLRTDVMSGALVPISGGRIARRSPPISVDDAVLQSSQFPKGWSA